MSQLNGHQRARLRALGLEAAAAAAASLLSTQHAAPAESDATAPAVASLDVDPTQKLLATEDSTALEIASKESDDAKRLAEFRALARITIQTQSSGGVATDYAWSYPVTEKERERSLVYTALWNHGFFLTSAAKFGGDFMAYPGDPFRYMAFHVIWSNATHFFYLICCFISL